MIYVPELDISFSVMFFFFLFFLWFGETISESFDNIVFNLDKRIFCFLAEFLDSKAHIIVF